MRARLIIAATCVAAGCLAGLARAEDAPPAAASTLKGEVIDPAAYLKEGAHGSETAEQTYEAVDGGQTLALLEEGTGAVYLFLAEEPGEDPNELAYDFVNQQVTVQGRVHERGGLHGIVPLSIEPVQAPSAESPATAPTTY